MDVMEAIAKRRSIRHYKPDAIPQEVLDRLLNTLRLAPSGSNRQPWKFIVVRDQEMREKLAAVCRYTMPSGKLNVQKWVAEAPVIIVACGFEKEAAAGFIRDGEFFIAKGEVIIDEMGKKSGEYTSLMAWDLAIALDHFSLAAMAEGLGTCWIAGLNEREVKKLFAIPDDARAQLAMTVGYPASSWPSPRSRKSIDEIICYDRYG